MAEGHSWAGKEKQQRVVVSVNKTVFQSCLSYLLLLWFTRNCVTPLNLTFPSIKWDRLFFVVRKVQCVAHRDSSVNGYLLLL